jgi:hypothetical protein
MITLGPALLLFGFLATVLALVTYLYMEADNRHEAREHRLNRKSYLLEQYFRLKEDLGLDPESVIDNEAEYYEIYEAIENASDVTDDDRKDLVGLLEIEFQSRVVPTAGLIGSQKALIPSER